MPNRPSAPAEGEALQRLIERFIETAERYRVASELLFDGPIQITIDMVVARAELQAALAPLAGPVDASGEPDCPECGYFIGHKDFCTVGHRRAVFCPNCKRTQPTDGVRLTFQCSYCGFRLPDNADLPAAAVPSSPAQPSGDDLSMAFKQGWDAHAALPPSSPVADSPTTKDVDYAIKALDAAALWEPAAMLKLADTLEQPPHYAMCESQYLRGIAQRIQAASAPSPSAGANKE